MGDRPATEFSPWYPWAQRSSFSESAARGIYVIAKGSQATSPAELPIDVLYIGETHGRAASLRKRLRNFHVSGSTGKKGHAGGVTYHGLDFDPFFREVFFAVLPCAIDHYAVGAAWIFYKERELIWKYADRHGRLPACNSE